MPGKADHRVIAAAANEALRLIKKTSRTQKHNEEPVYQSIGGHEYANKSLNYLPAASIPAPAQPKAGGGPDAHQTGFVPLSSWPRTKRGDARPRRGEHPPLQCSLPAWHGAARIYWAEDGQLEQHLASRAWVAHPSSLELENFRMSTQRPMDPPNLSPVALCSVDTALCTHTRDSSKASHLSRASRLFPGHR